MTLCASRRRYPTDAATGDDRDMDTDHDDHSRFERLCLLRALYARRGERDRLSVISLDDAMRIATSALLEPDPTSTSGAH